MLQELTAGEAARPDFVTRALTPVIRRGAEYLLRWEPRGSILVQLPTGQRIRFGRSSANDEPLLILRNYRVLANCILRGPIGFAASYIDGDFDCPDLAALFRFYLRNRAALRRSGQRLFRVRATDRLAHLLRRNSKRGSRRNIAEHYDLGNEFYRRWLDAGMHYSSGLFVSQEQSLEEAQETKLDLIVEMLNLGGGEKILEIGCGWGAFARRAAGTQGTRVTGITLSREQLAFARARARREGLQGFCDFRLQDYRDMGGAYDRIVSIEMIEAVGEENWPRYFATLRDRLKPGGLAVLQAITIGEEHFEAYRRRADFIQRYIFPGGMLPTSSAIASNAERAGLSLDPVHTFGASYARTLREWRKRFEAAWPEIVRLGYDERFRRRWRYYLDYCEAGFEEGMIDVGLYRLRKPA